MYILVDFAWSPNICLKLRCGIVSVCDLLPYVLSSHELDLHALRHVVVIL